MSVLATITQCKVASGTFVMLASAVHNVAKYYQKVLENTTYQWPKRSSNKIRILQTKFEFGKKNEFNIPNLNCGFCLVLGVVYTLVGQKLRACVSMC